MELLTKETFRKKVFDFEKGGDSWEFEGERPAIVDFYAEWCGPCKMVAPVLEEISREYAGKVDVYKVNTDEEHDIANAFGISSIPTILFIPKTGQPQVSRGAMPKAAFVETIKNVFNIQ